MLLSIIVPVYNVEKYLPDCLDSLLMQDIAQDEYEIICVNDGAKDSSPLILNEYAAKHANIRVINKQTVAFLRHAMLVLSTHRAIIFGLLIAMTALLRIALARLLTYFANSIRNYYD